MTLDDLDWFAKRANERRKEESRALREANKRKG
jgi:hypothetical protein